MDLWKKELGTYSIQEVGIDLSTDPSLLITQRQNWPLEKPGAGWFIPPKKKTTKRSTMTYIQETRPSFFPMVAYPKCRIYSFLAKWFMFLKISLNCAGTR
jgi:hypothetical protein